MKKSTSLLVVAFVLLWNSGFIGAEYGLPYASTFSLLFWRYLALTGLLLIYLVASQRLVSLPWSVVGRQMLIGILAHALFLSGTLLALENKVPAGIVALVVALMPMLTGAFSGRVTGEHTRRYQWLGLGLGFAGVALTVGSRIDFASSSSVFSYLLPLFSVFAMAGASLIERRTNLQQGEHKLALDLNLFYQSLAAFLVISPPAIFYEGLQTEWTSQFIYAMLWLVGPVSLGAYGLMWRLIERMDATRVSSLFYLGPPVTMVMGWLAFGDKVRLTDLLGLAIVFLGVVFTQYSPNYMYSKLRRKGRRRSG